MAQEEPKKFRGLFWGAVILAVCVGVYFLMAGSRSTITVRAGQVEQHDLVSVVSTNGKVEPTADFQAHSPAPGVVQRLFVSLGDKVHAGQELIRMDDSDARKNLAAAQAQLEGAEATLKNMQNGGTSDEILGASSDMSAAQSQQRQAEASLASLQKLQAQGSASANEVSSAKQRVADAQAKISALKTRSTGRYGGGDMAAQRSQVAQAQAAVDAARALYAGVDIHAPFAGTVYAIPVAEYDFVQGGEALLNLADLTQLQVEAYFDEPEIGKLSAGQPVKIVWDAKPNQTWHGHILQAPTTIISYGTRNVGECIITVDDAKGDLLPNTNVTVTVTTSQKFNVLSLPREALHPEGLSNFVYKIVDGRLVKTPVQIGASNLTRFEVTGGLQQGDQVALGATTQVELTNGQRVKVQP